MASSEDLYAVLGVLPTSDDVVIRGAYKALMMKYHPDTSRSREATNRAAAINAAYATLGDPDRRAAYDRQNRRSRKPAEAPAANGDSGRDDLADDPSRNLTMPSEPRRSYVPLTLSALGACLAGAAAIAISAGYADDARRTAQAATAPNVSAARNVAAAVSAAIGPTPAMADSVIEASATPADVVEVFSGEAQDAPVVAPEEPREELPPARDPMNRQTLAPAVNAAEVADAARDVDRVLWTSGLGLAKAESEVCREVVAKRPSWIAADRCAAYDYAVHLIDARISEARGIPQDAYFKARGADATDLYRDSNLGPYFARQRLQRIRGTAEAVASRLMEDQAQRRTRVAAYTGGTPGERVEEAERSVQAEDVGLTGPSQ